MSGKNGALGNMNPSSELISEFKVSQFNNNAEFVAGGRRHHYYQERRQPDPRPAHSRISRTAAFDATPYGF